MIRTERTGYVERGRATQAWSGNPQWLPSLGTRRFVCRGSPQSCDPQLRSQSLGIHAISCQHAGYGAIGRRPSGWKTGVHGERTSRSVQTDARTHGSPTRPQPKRCPQWHFRQQYSRLPYLSERSSITINVQSTATLGSRTDNLWLTAVQFCYGGKSNGTTVRSGAGGKPR